MMISELDDTEKEVLLGKVVERPLTEMKGRNKLNQVNEDKNLGDAIVDRETGQGVSASLDEVETLHYRLSEASRVMLAVAGELSKGSRRVASDLELLERLHDEARAIALANMPADESAKRPISDRPNDGQAS